MTNPEQGTLIDAEPYRVHKPRAEFVVPDDYEPETRAGRAELGVQINKEHAFAVIDDLMEAYRTNAFPYNLDSTRLPQDERHMPERLERGSVEHARFFFNVCYYMRGGVKSNLALKLMGKLYDSRPELFDPFVAQGLDPQELDDELKQAGLGFRVSTVKHWIENSRRLVDLYDGDPREILDGVTNYEESLMRFRNNKRGGGFLGFQEKMTSMILYYLMSDGMVDEFKFPIPVDFHVMRVSVASEMITFDDHPAGTNLYTDEFLEAVRTLYYDYAVEKDVSALELSNAVWMLSESICGDNPGNVTTEPIGRAKRNGRATILIAQNTDILDPAQRASYARSCAQCPIESSCEHNVPGSHYYIAGALIKRGPRIRFPEPNRLF